MLDDDRIARLAADAYALFDADEEVQPAWADADAFARAANLDYAHFIPRALLAALDLDVAASGADGHHMTSEEVEAGGRLEHLRWCRFTRRAGRRDHPDLVAWSDRVDPRAGPAAGP